jgi:hypothetical protein
MSFQKIIIRRASIAGLLILSAGTICGTAFGLSPGWPGNPATYLQINTMEDPVNQYRDTSTPPNTGSPYGPFTCVAAMYLNKTDPTQFQIIRTFEARSPNNVYGAVAPVSEPLLSAQYSSPGQLATNVSGLVVYPHPENPYGRETLSLYTLDSHGNRQTLLEQDRIMVYPLSTAKIFNVFVPNPTPNPIPVASPSPYPNPSPYPIPTPWSSPSSLTNFTGDTARLNIEIYNAYPGGSTWVVVYPGNFSSIPPISAKEVTNGRQTAPTTDLIPKWNVFIEVGTSKDTSGALLFTSSASRTPYTIQVLQNTAQYGQETLATATFTVVSSSFKVNSQVGKTAP